ncbi:hypothetical protein B0H14DRAFT_2653979 [Mycena olivaceomarginata]|nr:hypothetical protein B0H14DRAFT_2653979 [Mycena olivaceomarginata]
MILAVKTIAAGAEFVPVPYIRAAFGTVAIFLETVDARSKSSFCFEMRFRRMGMWLAHDHGAVREFRVTGLENMRNRAGLRGRFKEFLRTTTVADQIDRYRIRLNELRSNFILAATIQTNLKVASIQKSFRRIALGDINLLYETAMSSNLYKVKVFSARISGEPSLMTVAKYEDDNDRWHSDLELYSRLRYNCGAGCLNMSGTELIPLHIYRQFHRPTSTLHGSASKECSYGFFYVPMPISDNHSRFKVQAVQGQEATICVKREPVRLCLTMPGLGNNSEVEDLEHDLSSWHSVFFRHQNLTTGIRAVSNILTTLSCTTPSGEVAKHIDLRHAFAALIPVRFTGPTLWKMQKEIFLASVITQRCEPGEDFLSVGYIPNLSRVQLKKWEMCPIPSVYSDPDLNRFTFLPGSCKALELPRHLILLTSSIKFEHEDEAVKEWLTRWRVQSCLTPNAMIFASGGHNAASASFVCPVGIRHDVARFWHEYHYNAIREFYEAKGFGPNSDDVTRLLDLHLAQVEPNILTTPRDGDSVVRGHRGQGVDTGAHIDRNNEGIIRAAKSEYLDARAGERHIQYRGIIQLVPAWNTDIQADEGE